MEKRNKANTYSDYLLIGIRYLKNQRYYLLFNLVILILLVLAQMINWFFMINIPLNSQPSPIDVYTPLFILMIISFAMIFHIYYFQKFSGQLHRIKNYDNKILENSYAINEENDVDQTIAQKNNLPSLTETMYLLNDLVKDLQFILLIVGLFAIFYLIWFVRFFIQDLSFIEIISLSPPAPRPGRPIIPHPPPIIRLFNYITVISIILFLIINVRHYWKWHIKFTKLTKLERRIYEELDLTDQDGEIL